MDHVFMPEDLEHDVEIAGLSAKLHDKRMAPRRLAIALKPRQLSDQSVNKDKTPGQMTDEEKAAVIAQCPKNGKAFEKMDMWDTYVGYEIVAEDGHCYRVPDVDCAGAAQKAAQEMMEVVHQIQEMQELMHSIVGNLIFLGGFVFLSFFLYCSMYLLWFRWQQTRLRAIEPGMQ